MIPPRPLGLRPFLVLFLGACPTLVAQGTSLRGAALTLDRERVRWGPELAGSQWARGADYKAGFDANGAQFVPFLGSDAPRNYPLALRAKSARVGSLSLAVQAAAVPRRAADTVEFERGGLVERYELAPHAVEQSFVLGALPARGELVLELGIATELELQAGPGGLAFGNERGGVRYGRATAIDARGARCDAPVEPVEGGLEIRVPAAFVEQAVLPLVVDPVLSSFVLTQASTNDFLPDPSFNSVTGQYVVVWEQVFSATDHDLVGALLDSTGTLVDTEMLDTSVSNWAHPRVASGAGNSFALVVAQVGLTTSGTRLVAAQRLRFPASQLLVDPAVVIHASGTGDNVDPDIGVDTQAASNGERFGVVWQRVPTGGGGDIVFQLINGLGAPLLGSDLVVAATTDLERRPSIASASLASDWWGVAWERELTSTNHDIYVAQVDTSGALLASPLALANTSADETRPSVSTRLEFPAHWMVGYEFLSGASHDIHAYVLVDGSPILTANLTQIEDNFYPGLQGDEQVEPSVESDGKNFVYSYASAPVGGSDYDIKWATLSLITTSGTRLRLAEGNQGLGSTTLGEHFPRIAACASSGGPVARFLEVHQEIHTGPLQDDIRGTLFEAQDYTPYCFAGLDSPNCPCGNPPTLYGHGCNNSSNTGGAGLGETGTASLAADTVQFLSLGLKPSATCILLQGTNSTVSTFGMGVRCVSGLLRRLYARTASGGALAVPVAGDPSVSARSAALGDTIAAGERRLYLVYYRDATVLGGCPASSTFNTTNSGQLFWRP